MRAVTADLYSHSSLVESLPPIPRPMISASLANPLAHTVTIRTSKTLTNLTARAVGEGALSGSSVGMLRPLESPSRRRPPSGSGQLLKSLIAYPGPKGLRRRLVQVCPIYASVGQQSSCIDVAWQGHMAQIGPRRDPASRPRRFLLPPGGAALA